MATSTPTASLPKTMSAAVLKTPGPPSNIEITTLPLPTPSPGEVLIRIRAIGLNRSELFTRQGHSPGVQLPRVLGIEATGTVATCPGHEFHPGDVVMTCMGGMGRAFDGGYAEYTVVPARQVRRVSVELSTPPTQADSDSQSLISLSPTPRIGWAVLGAMPEMLQTAWGALTKGLRLQRDDRLLIRGGTTSVGLAAATLAHSYGAVVTSTSRRSDDGVSTLLQRFGANTTALDDGHLAATATYGAHFDKVLELVGTTTLRDSLACCRAGGVVCMAGIVGDAWTLAEPDRNPMELIPTGVCLTSYSGGEAEFLDMPLQELVSAVEKGEVAVPVGRVFQGLEHIVRAHELMEANAAGGKVVVLV